MRTELETLAEERKGPLHAAQLSTLDDLIRKVEALRAHVQPTPTTLPEWIRLTGSLVQPTADMATEIRHLIGSRGWEGMPGSPATARASIEEAASWADSLARAVRALDHEISSLVPWAEMLMSPPSLLVDGKHPEIAAQWSRLEKLPDPYFH